MLVLKGLRVRRITWGEKAGQLTGEIEWMDDASEVTFTLTDEQVQRIFDVCADAIIEVGKEAAEALTCRVREQKEGDTHALE